MHEFVASASVLKEQYGVTAQDVAKALIDEGTTADGLLSHLVDEALMFEPTERERGEPRSLCRGVLPDLGHGRRRS